MTILFAILALAYFLEGAYYISKKRWKLAIGEFTLVGILLFIILT